MPSMKIIHPLLLKHRQPPPRLSRPRLSRQLPQMLKIFLEIRMHQREPGPVAFGRDAVCFPALLSVERWETGFSGEDAGGGYGLPFEDFEG